MFAALRVFSVFIVLGIGAAAYGGWLLANWNAFDPTTIGVQGNARVAGGEILRRAAIPADRNVWLIDKAAAQRRVEAIPWIRTARIHRALPNGVTIDVTEREPAGCVEAASGSYVYLVDDQARVLEVGCPPSLAPVFVLAEDAALRPGATLPSAGVFRRLLADSRLLASDHIAAARLRLAEFDSLEVTLRSGLIVRFGKDRDLAEKAGLVDPILRTYGPRAPDLAVIDLRSPTTPVVRERGRPKV
ncbi:MAG: FtsQ-type POTRA domain-containing protein [Candidatus Eremiobacteraeota bacterium]|nr:FtsQ-type POTRA domain-containing protein [Candidatus Eremiobacteraeota bacterium]